MGHEYILEKKFHISPHKKRQNTGHVPHPQEHEIGKINLMFNLFIYKGLNEINRTVKIRFI